MRYNAKVIFFIICVSLNLYACNDDGIGITTASWVPPSNPCYKTINIFQLSLHARFVPASLEDCPFVEELKTDTDSIIWAVHHKTQKETLTFIDRNGYYEREYFENGIECKERRNDFFIKDSIVSIALCSDTNLKCEPFLLNVEIIEPQHITWYNYDFCNSVIKEPITHYSKFKQLLDYSDSKMDYYVWWNEDTMFTCDLFSKPGKGIINERLDTLIRPPEYRQSHMLAKYMYWGKN